VTANEFKPVSKDWLKRSVANIDQFDVPATAKSPKNKKS
jgi:hypothetical protein